MSRFFVRAPQVIYRIWQLLIVTADTWCQFLDRKKGLTQTSGSRTFQDGALNMHSFAMNAAPFAGSYAEIEEIAELVRRECLKGLELEGSPPTGPQVSTFLTNSVELFGGKIVPSTVVAAEEWSGGSLLIRPNDEPKFEISLSPFTSPLRDNFTIAHELGHYFLHYALFYSEDEVPDEPLVFYRYGSGLQESQANRFAAAFLMPRVEFDAVLHQAGNDLRAVAAHFNVSHAAAEARNSYR